LREQEVKAVFFESKNPKVTTEIVKETGAKTGGKLFVDGLGEIRGSNLFRHDPA
jgi:ABC-type Zn uptake system ZnuABC Zn-binding protein ZnuA